ncbi:sigma-70 family RNA polymerase sigma factor [Nonomuraea angiospora]|uniref:RNA polymerase sigma factor n=1 Tax=Nonomuraea angiospora TaxID=46172 RepID=UPI0033C2DAE9
MQRPHPLRGVRGPADRPAGDRRAPDTEDPARRFPAVAPTDTTWRLVAQSGDSAALGTLLARHRAGMLAVAVSVLRDPAEGEDAVQDASLTALARIGDLRDPAAVGPWLRMIVRNLCRKRLNATTAIPAGDLPPSPERAADPQEVLERHAQRHWVWHAVGLLSPPLRTVTLRAAIDASPDGSVSVTLEQVPMLVPELPEAAQRLFHELLVPQPGAYFLQALDVDGVTTLGLPAAYVLGENDLALARPGDELAARIGLTPLMVPGGHQSMLTHPDEVAEALLKC